jgi:hypothetical protein
MVKEAFNFITRGFPALKTEKELKFSVLNRLDHERKKMMKNHYIVGLFFSILCLSSLVYSLVYFLDETLHSGFLNYLELLFFDFGALNFIWKDLFFSLIVSLPIFELIMISISVLSLLLLSVWLVNKYRPPLLVK